LKTSIGTFSTYPLVLLFSLALIFYSASAANIGLTKVWAANPYQITNEEVKDNYLVYIKQKVNQGQDGSPSPDCQPGLGKLKKEGPENLQSSDLCNPGLENMKKKLGSYEQDKKQGSGNDKLDDKIINKLSDKINKK